VLRHALRGLAAAAAALALLACVPAGGAREAPARGQMADIGVAELPGEARETLALIKKGGPFPYRKDGSAFGNREGHLPRQSRGYYTEYTVRTPSERDRGARRIVAGKGSTGDPASSGEYYYTDDHYNSFRRIRE
jgi:ribonuclease T1